MPWRDSLQALLASGSFRTQGELVEALALEGVEVNQGTVSRELQSMGVSKVEGFYRLPPPPELPAPIHSVDLTAGGCLAVIHTDPAFASVLGQHLDDAQLDGLLGTIAGDNAVFAALSGPPAADRLLRALGLSRPRRRPR